METLLQWDTTLFHWINQGWSHPVLDVLMPFARNKIAWVPLYAFCVMWIIFNFPVRNTAYIFVFVAASITAADTISSKLIKYQVMRPRPCHEQLMDPPIVQRVRCGGGYSFTSSHAANHFCLAAFLVTLFGPVMKRWKHLWWLWAAWISLAQVYVGLHYPLDILCGGLLGAMIGLSFGLLCKRMLKGPKESREINL